MTAIAERVFNVLTSGTDDVHAHYGKLPTRKDPSDNVIPAVVITVGLGGHNQIDLRGDDGLRRRIVRLDAYASTRGGADALMAVCVAKMEAATTFKVADASESGAPDYEADVERFRASNDFVLWFEE